MVEGSRTTSSSTKPRGSLAVKRPRRSRTPPAHALGVELGRAAAARPRANRSGRVAAFLERVEDEVEAVLERGCEVVANFGDMSGDDFSEVRKLLCERGELPLLRE